MREESKVNSKIGEIRLMKCGEECEIVEHASHKDMVVKFLKTGELVKCRYEHFKRGLIKSHFTPTVFGVGVTGLENARDNNRNIIKSYEVWQHILERCYNKNVKKNVPLIKIVWFVRNGYIIPNSNNGTRKIIMRLKDKEWN